MSLTHKLRLFLRDKMSLQMPEPRITGPENCKPETSWPSKLQIKKRHKMTINLSLFVLFFKKRPNSQTRLECLSPTPFHGTLQIKPYILLQILAVSFCNLAYKPMLGYKITIPSFQCRPKYLQVRFDSTIYLTHYTSTGEGDGTPLQYSCLENPMDGGAC